ncbi:hypothetical protein KA005_19450, partial [bacterium]|nr:hypothetical protein [bacterium]
FVRALMLIEWIGENIVNLILVIGTLAAITSAIYAILNYKKIVKRENPNIKMGFAKGAEIVEELEIKPEGESQKVYFRIFNESNLSLKMPICSVKFPEAFKHKQFIDKEDGTREWKEGYTVNSDLWGLGRGTTRINMNLPNSMWEIYGMPAVLLRSKETIDFFIRFAIPSNPMTYVLDIKLDAEGAKGFIRELKLNVNPS